MPGQFSSQPQSEDDLFLLIQNLEKSERRYFRLFAKLTQRKTNKSTVELFELISQMEIWDESLLLNKASGYPWFPNLSNIKHRLYNQILKSLRLLREGKQPESQLWIQLENLEILYQKGLIQNLQKRLKSLEKKAGKYQLPEIAIQIQKWKRRIELINPPRTGLERPVFKGAVPLQILSYETQLSGLHDYLRVLIRYKYSGKKTRNNQIQDILEDSVLNEIPQGTSLRAKVHFLNANGLGRLALGKPKEALPFYKELMEAWDDRPEWIATDPDLYFSSLNNYFNCRLYVFDKTFTLKIGTLNPPAFFNSEQKLRFERMKMSVELISINLFGGDESIFSRVEAIGKWLEGVESRIDLPHWLGIAFNLATFYFLRDSFSLANQWLMLILGREKRHVRQDLRIGSMFLQIALQTLQDNYDIVENLLRNTRRKIQDLDLEFELKVLELIRSFYFAKELSDKNQSLQELVDLINDFQGKETIKMPPGLLEIRLWAESIQGNTTIRSLVKSIRGY